MVYAAGHVPPQPQYHFAEFFAGQKAITKGLLANGYTGVTFEKEDCPLTQDILTDSGFANAVCIVLNIVPGGLAWYAIVCSTWVWMSRSSTGRRLWNPDGHRESDSVRAGNKMLTRVVLLILLGHILKITNILENPASTVIEFHRFFAWLASRMQLWKTDLKLGYYGAASAKDVRLYSDRNWIGHIHHFAARNWHPRSCGVTRKDRKPDGTVAITGDSGLKATQAYPILFGAALASCFHRFHDPLGVDGIDCDGIVEIDDLLVDDTECPWIDTTPELDTVIQYLMRLVSNRAESI